MKLLYTHENITIVQHIQNCLREHGIESLLKNEFSAGGAGELSPLETWPELWVNTGDFSAGQQIVATITGPQQGENWQCRHCGEENAASFEVCWHCQADSSGAE